MFGLFRKKSKSEMLKQKYEKFLEEFYKLSHTNRTASSLKATEADEVLKEMEKLSSQSK